MKKIGARENVNDLIPLLKDENRHVQGNAAETIGKIGPNENVEDLLPLLKKINVDVRVGAVKTMKYIGSVKMLLFTSFTKR